MHTRDRRIAAFGLRSLPPRAGSAGEDKCSSELYPRLVKRGWQVTAYTRVYNHPVPEPYDYLGVTVIPIKTTRRSGFDTLLHSAKASWHIIRHNTGRVVHVHNGGNSIWALLLRLFRKRVFISQDGVDWTRDKWPWYGRVFLFLSAVLTAYIPTGVIIDNVFVRDLFQRRFKRKFSFIPYGSEVPKFQDNSEILQQLGLESDEYFLFVGRFIPDKGLHYLIPAFEMTSTSKKLLLVGGSLNPSDYEAKIQKTKDKRVLFPGYIYGNDVLTLMRNAYAYVQPSDVEGLSPVILMVMGLGTPMICSDIPENRFVVEDNALLFERADVGSLAKQLRVALEQPERVRELADRAETRIHERFNWERVADDHVMLFSGQCRTIG